MHHQYHTPDIDAVPEAELPDQELYHSVIVGGLRMFSLKMQNILVYNMSLQLK